MVELRKWNTEGLGVNGELIFRVSSVQESQALLFMGIYEFVTNNAN